MGGGDPSKFTQRSLAPIGKLGFRGRAARPEERAKVLEAYLFEGERRTPYLQQYFVLMLLSATIAGLGLVNDSAAVVIGAMLVAPLMTPILAIAASLVQGWGRRIVESLAIVLAGALVAIGVGFAIGLVVPALQTSLPLPGELMARTEPNLIDLAIAVAAGAAGGFVAVRSEASGALPGVGIAVALVPPLAAVGITLGVGELGLAAGALVLFLTNLVAIILSAGLVLVAAGFAAYRDDIAERHARYGRIAVTIGLFVVCVPLAVNSLQRLEDQTSIAMSTEAVAEWAPELSLQDLEIDRSAKPVSVTVVVSGIEDPPPAAALAELLAAALGEAVEVGVAFAPVERAVSTEP